MARSIAEPVFCAGDGKEIGKRTFMAQLSESVKTALGGGKKCAVLVGENHHDPEAHRLQLDILKHLPMVDAVAGGKVATSLEFYDRDVQPVLNEYLDGVIDLGSFLSDARPPGNHEDYQPLIDHCKGRGLPVIASNCPRRYTKFVARKGRGALADLAASNDYYVAARSAFSPLPPLPYRQPSERYRQQFFNVMGVVSGSGAEFDCNDDTSKLRRMLDAQSLWDATMAYSICQGFKSSDVVLHVTGYFHVLHKLGICEHLAEYCGSEEYEAITVCILPEEPVEERLKFRPEEHAGAGDFVVLTDLNSVL